MEQETRINFEIEECIRVLKQLQSKEEVLITEDDSPPEVKGPNRVQAMRKWVSRSGITLDSIDGLNIIHVSGTKGKGSTCAFCESILRHHGYRTGFFSSPHLVEVRERIRINGQPISKEKFVSYFWDVYNELEATKTVDNNSMPGFFRFMCIMAFHAFQKEQTDVVIMEVGVGGEWDGTNIIRKPSVCGVTSLGIDHIDMLGNTIENIAWHKGGIFKHGVPAFTSPQPAEAIKVLQDRAQKIGCNLEVVPPFESYQVPGGEIKLGLAGHIQTVNASLALQITKTWMNSQENCRNGTCNFIVNDSTDLKIANSFPLTPAFINGLVECKWLGRNQQIKRKQLTYYIDGAHTVESIEQCIDWFQEHSKMEAANIRGKVVKILVFSTTGERDSSQLQPPLMKGGFDAVVFCPVILHRGSKPDIAMTKQLLTRESEMKNCQNNMDTWKRMFQAAPMNCVHKKCNQVISDMDHQTKAAQAQHHTDCIGNGVSSDHTANGETLNHAANGFSSDLQPRNISNRQAVDSDSHIIMLPCIYDALLWASHKNDPHLKASFDLPAQIRGADHVQVLITGSLYLVGAAIGILSNSL